MQNSNIKHQLFLELQKKAWKSTQNINTRGTYGINCW